VSKMDPNELLKELKDLVAGIKKRECESIATPEEMIELYVELAEKFEALDVWLTKGGFIPSQWRAVKDAKRINLRNLCYANLKSQGVTSFRGLSIHPVEETCASCDEVGVVRYTNLCGECFVRMHNITAETPPWEE
jgi:hypothetical protein